MSKCSAKNRRCAGGDEWCIGGTLRIEDGATLDVAEGATVNGLAAGGGLIVNFTTDFDTGIISSDKTVAEIKRAWLEGKQIIGKMKIEQDGIAMYSDIPFSSYAHAGDMEMAIFTSVVSSANAGVSVDTYLVNADGTVTNKRTELAEKLS